jgi:transposase
VTARRAYPSDISDARWALIGPTLTAWQQARLDRRPTGEPARTDVRDVLNAIFHVNRTGIPWKYLSHDFPPHTTVYSYYAAWRDEGIFAQLNVDLTAFARVKAGARSAAHPRRHRYTEREDFHQPTHHDPGNRRRDPPGQFRGHDPHRDDRQRQPPNNGRNNTYLEKDVLVDQVQIERPLRISDQGPAA